MTIEAAFLRARREVESESLTGYGWINALIWALRFRIQYGRIIRG